MTQVQEEERKAIDIAEGVIEQFESTQITYLPNERWLVGSIEHYTQPRGIVLNDAAMHYVKEYVIDYFESA